MASVSGGKIKTLVVDDEPMARENLLALLKRDSEIEIVGQCKSGTEAVDVISRLRPDLVFLDVQMPGCDGFDVVEQLGPSLPRVVIFVTAHDHYAMRAFEVEALDYLLKPFSTQRFTKVLERAKAFLQDREELPRRIVLKTNGRAVFLSVADIDWIEAADYYASIHIGQRSHLIRRSLADLEVQLTQDQFARVHRSAIVNLRRIHSITPDANGDSEVCLTNGTRVRLSRGYREQVQRRIAHLTQ